MLGLTEDQFFKLSPAEFARISRAYHINNARRDEGLRVLYMAQGGKKHDWQLCTDLIGKGKLTKDAEKQKIRTYLRAIGKTEKEFKQHLKSKDNGTNR